MGAACLLQARRCWIKIQEEKEGQSATHSRISVRNGFCGRMKRVLVVGFLCLAILQVTSAYDVPKGIHWGMSKEQVMSIEGKNGLESISEDGVVYRRSSYGKPAFVGYGFRANKLFVMVIYWRDEEPNFGNLKRLMEKSYGVGIASPQYDDLYLWRTPSLTIALGDLEDGMAISYEYTGEE